MTTVDDLYAERSEVDRHLLRPADPQRIDELETRRAELDAELSARPATARRLLPDLQLCAPRSAVIRLLEAIERCPTNLAIFRSDHPVAPEALRLWADGLALHVEELGDTIELADGSKRWSPRLRVVLPSHHTVEVYL